MADEPENRTLCLLREMREENQRLHAGTREQLATVLKTVAEVGENRKHHGRSR